MWLRVYEHGAIDMGVDLHQKVGGGPNRKIIGSKNLVFLKTFKNVKSANFGFFLFVLQFIVLIKFNFIF